MSYLVNMPGKGIAPSGPRHDSMTAKGLGYFGPIPHPTKKGQLIPDTYSTELSSADEHGDYPLLVPTMPREYIDMIIQGVDLPDYIHEIARKHAEMRRAQGLSPFAMPNEMRYPLPEYGKSFIDPTKDSTYEPPIYQDTTK